MIQNEMKLKHKFPQELKLKHKFPQELKMPWEKGFAGLVLQHDSQVMKDTYFHEQGEHEGVGYGAGERGHGK